jgi:nucleoside-diphosphate-sugar epimerase
LSKRAADDFLRALDLDWFVLRPSPIYGRGGTSANFFMRLAGLPLIPMIGDGKQALQPIHISDVAATVLHALTTSATKQTLDVAGTEAITFGEWLQWMRQAQGLPHAPLLHFPLALVETLMRIGSRFSPLLRIDNLRMLQASHHVDVQPFTDFLGRAPLKLEPRLFFSDILNTGNPQ